MLKGDAKAIRVLGYSRPIPNGAIAVNPNLDPGIVSSVTRALLDIGKTEAGRKDLAQMYLIEQFAPATSADYDPVREAFHKVGFALK